MSDNATPTPLDDETTPICPLCHRPIPATARQSLHHLVPKLKGGRAGPTVLLHQICHNEIHSCLTEAELAQRFNTIEALRDHPKIAAFVAWVATKTRRFTVRASAITANERSGAERLVQRRGDRPYRRPQKTLKSAIASQKVL